MKLSAVGLVAIIACTPANALDRPSRPSVILVRENAPGDSLTYRLIWTAAARADAYEVTVTASPSTGWSGLPTASRVTTLNTQFIAVNPTWGTVQFDARICSVKANVVYTNKCSTVIWNKSRTPDAPGPITVDSTGAVGIIIKPDTVTLAVSDTTRFCAFVLATDGKVYGVNYSDGTTTVSYPKCVTGYATWFPINQRVNPLTILAYYNKPEFIKQPVILASK